MAASESRLKVLIKDHYPRTGNLEYAILKSHIIIEQAITFYIEARSKVKIDLGKKRWDFSKKVDVAYIMGFGVNNPIIIPSIDRLNSIRNKVAHTFELDRNLVDEMLRINSHDYDEFVIDDDRQRIRLLKLLCEYISAFVIGETQAHHAIERMQRNSFAKHGPLNSD
jgi:hypothetical protein